MKTINDYYQYSRLANAAYIVLDDYVFINPQDLVIEANAQEREKGGRFIFRK